jgi:hypothetical protein
MQVVTRASSEPKKATNPTILIITGNIFGEGEMSTATKKTYSKQSK